ncbi:hypothetical protein PHET_00115 [Paragonimus heterotremus]|uniref:Uncharacterized protein n=1 Tax=Paragonimus heterotremus TaxID=100268 RepID=A0A8J4SVI7_9TREM|nr:hypothetical protein PHET_00115 [Paragonimus heterotremus]
MEKIFFRELLRTSSSLPSADSFTEEVHPADKSNSISLLLESQLSLPTIAGYELSYQWVLLGSSKNAIDLNIGPKFLIRLDLTESLQFNENLQLDGPFRRIGGTSQHQYAKFVLNLEGSGEANYNGQEVNLRLWLKPMPENHILLDFKTNRHMYVEENILELKPESNRLRVQYESPQAVNRLLGLKLAAQMNVPSTWFPLSIPSRLTLRVHHFYGLEQTVQLKFGNSLLGSFKRLYFLFQRPGQKREQDRKNDHAELLLHSDAVNKTAKFVHFKLALPLIREVTTMVEINENGIIHARANVTGSPWELYGNYQPTAQQTMFTAQLIYPQGEASVVFRGNLTDNFKLFLHNRDDKRPFHMQMTQRFLLSRHHHYPMFRRIHHETILQLLNNQTIDLQLEWNSGSRNGILEQGLAKLIHRSLTSETQTRFDVSWTEDVESSDLDSSVEGYARKLIIELHGGVNFSPFDLNYVAAGDVQIFVPLVNVDFGAELLSMLRLTTNNGLIKLVILHRCSENDTKNGVDFNTSYDYQLSTFAIKSILAIYLPQYGLLERKRYAGWDFHLTIKDRQRQITFDGSHAGFGSLLFHEKYRKFVGADTRFDGSAMFAVSPATPIRSFGGLYINYNYALKYTSYQYGIEFHGEYNPRSGTGPGTPLRLNVQFTHDGLFRYGNFELVLNSQALGYWTGYEMITIMSKYTTEGIDSETRNRTWTCRSILGYRFLEGRGTRALESAVQLTFSPSGDTVSVNVRAGLPGNINQNILECGYTFHPDRLQIKATVVVWNQDKLNARLFIAQNNNWETLEGEIVMKIPVINFDFALSETISITDDIILKENTEFSFCCLNLFNYKLQKDILILEKNHKNKSDRVGQVTWFSTINWLGNGSLQIAQTVTEKTKKQHLVTFLWNDHLIFKFDMIQSLMASLYNFTGNLGNKQVSALVNLNKSEVQGVRGESLEVHCKFPTRDFDFQLNHLSNYSELSHREKYLASQRFYLRTDLVPWAPVAWQQTFAQTMHKGIIQHILLVNDIDTASAQFLHLTINYTNDKVLHTRLSIVPELISPIGLENITVALDTQQFHGANENKDHSLNLFIQLMPWFPPTSGSLRVNLDRLECKNVVCESQVAGQIDSTQSEITEVWRVQGSMQRHGEKGTSLFSYQGLLNAENPRVTHRFAVSFGCGPKAFFIFGNVTGEQYLNGSVIKRQTELMRLHMNYGNNNTEFVSIFKLNILEKPLLYFDVNKFRSERTHRISFDFNIGTSSDLTQTYELHMLLNKDSEEITFALKNGPQDNLAVTGHDIYFGTNLFHILQKRDSPERLQVILKLFETFLNTTIDFDHVFGLVNIIHQNDESLTGMVQFQELVGAEQETVQMFVFRVNSSMPIIPSSIFIISLQKFYFQANDNLKKVITSLETEVENLIPKKHINLTLSLTHRDEDPLILLVENLYIFPFRAVLQLIQNSKSYYYKHRIESFNPAGESTSVYWNSTADCEVGSHILVDCSIKQMINGRVLGTVLDLKPHTGRYAVAAIWDEDNHGIMGFTVSMRNNSYEFELQTPLRHLTLKREKKKMVLPPTENIRWVVHSVPTDQTAIDSEHRSAHMAISWTRMNAENDTIYSQWFSGIELDSNFIKKNRIGATVNATFNDKSAALFLSSFLGENVQPKPALVIRIERMSNFSIYSEQSVQFGDHHMQLTGIHEIQATRFNSG